MGLSEGRGSSDAQGWLLVSCGQAVLGLWEPWARLVLV